MIDQNYLKTIFSYNPETGLFTRLRNSERYKIGQIAGCLARGYVVIRIDGILYPAHRLAWLYVHGVYPETFVDHANGLKSDNRIENLRLANKSQNSFNRPKQSNNTSGYKGVTFHAQTGKWRAKCAIKGKHLHVGLYETKEQAAIAYKEFAELHHGEFARVEPFTTLS